MVEYGNGVGQVSGQAGGGAGGGQADVGAALGQWVTDSVHTISTLPPTTLVAVIVIVFLGLMVLRRAF
jgi:hypothetical protein